MENTNNNIKTGHKNKVIVIWSPVGVDTSELSYELASELSLEEQVLLAELPCLGIPRLGFTLGSIQRNRNIEAEIFDLDKKGRADLTNVYKQSNTLSVIPADIYAYPDYPITQRVSLETLISFPSHLIEKGYQQGYTSIIFDCQGQVTTPMTYYALKYADKILIPIRRTMDIAFSLLNIKRLILAFNFDIDKFALLTKNKKLETFDEIVLLNNEEGKTIGKLDVCEEDKRAIINQVLKKTVNEIGLENKKKNGLYLIGKIFAKSDEEIGDDRSKDKNSIVVNEKKITIKL